MAEGNERSGKSYGGGHKGYGDRRPGNRGGKGFKPRGKGGFKPRHDGEGFKPRRREDGEGYAPRRDGDGEGRGGYRKSYGKSGGFYRCSKQACEIYIENYQAMYGLPYTILRYGSLYGPRADMRNAIHRFVHEALTTGSITYYGTATALREYVHVDDASSATLHVLGPEFANQNIIISGNQPMRVADLFRMIGEMLGKELEIRYQNDPNSGHYQVTPYAFMPRMGRKLVPPLTVDLGQGILRVMEEEHRQIHPELQSQGGYLVSTDD